MNMQVQNTNQPQRVQAPKPQFMDEYTVYANSMMNCKYTFTWGKDAPFINGEYATNQVAEVEELNNEIAMGNPFISFKCTRKELYSDPHADIKAKAVADYLANQARALDGTKDGGSTEQGKLTGIGNSSDVAAAASGSSSGAGASVASVSVGLTGMAAKGIGAALVGTATKS